MGFHPEFTGRENARMNAALLGPDRPRDPAAPAGDPRLRRARRFLRPPGADLLLGHGAAPRVRRRDACGRRRPDRGRGARGRATATSRRSRSTGSRSSTSAAERCSSARTRSTTSRSSATRRSGCKNGARRRAGPALPVVRALRGVPPGEGAAARRDGGRAAPGRRTERAPARAVHGRLRARRLGLPARGVRGGGDRGRRSRVRDGGSVARLPRARRRRPRGRRPGLRRGHAAASPGRR